MVMISRVLFIGLLKNGICRSFLFIVLNYICSEKSATERRNYIMPKMKTHRGAAKRFKKTGSGKFKRANAFKSHILTKKSSKRKRNLRKTSYVSSTQEKTMRKLLPYL
jgi:large subunit ribosomal protein L35